MDCVGGLNAQCDSNNRPDTMADCNHGPCPEWKVGEWQEVAISTVFVFDVVVVVTLWTLPLLSLFVLLLLLLLFFC